MLLTFLKAAVPLSKSLAYSARDDAYTMSHYPMVKKVTSEEEVVTSMLGFRDKIEDHAARGHCLLFGGLTRPLKDESRAEHAKQNEEHEWICFDFDKVDETPNMEGALRAIQKYLPPCCQEAECVIQLSPSCFNPHARKLSCHVFMRLLKPLQGPAIKDFLTWINFNSPLVDQIKLTDSTINLGMRLDRCVTDSSRLIYIAPPRMVGFKRDLAPEDWLGHFEGTSGFVIPAFTPVPRQQINEKINELREAQGLDRREFRTVKFRGLDVFEGTDEGVISDVRPSGEGFIRFNINGGDSLAYWINLKQPEVIGNFKGEPYMFTKNVDESFYKSLIKSTKQTPQRATLAEGTEVLAFYATNRGSTLYIGTYDRAKDKLRVDKSNETAAASWLKQFGIPVKPNLPHYDLIHDISDDVRFEEGYPVINLYERTNLAKQYAGADKVRAVRETMPLLDQQCPVISKFLRSITGDDRSAQGFLNWLAFIFQYRVKTGTAWLLWGVEGSGKGKFLEHVAKPLFGETSVSQVMMSSIDKDFNSLLEGKLLVNIDEAAMSRTRDKVEAMSKFRNWITEPTMVINEKNVTERIVPSFVNFIISSNDYRPLVINTGDRRFHVGTRQEKRLLPTANEFATLVQGEELPAFAKLLGEMIIDENWVRNPEMTEQKMRLFESTHSLLDNVAMAIAAGDASFFFEARPSSVILGSTTHNSLLPIKQYDDLLRAMHNNTLNVLKHEDLYVLFQVVVNDLKYFPDNPTMQKQIFNRYGLAPKKQLPCRRTGRKAYGTEAPEWQRVPEYLLEVIDIAPVDNVTPIRTKK